VKKPEKDQEAASAKSAQVAKHIKQLWQVREEVQNPHDLLIQAKALLLCALPYKRTDAARITKQAQIGRDLTLSVTFATMSEAGLPYGADRALFAWIQTKAYPDGFVSFDSLREFLKAFELDEGGKNYKRFYERLERLKGMAVSIKVEGPTGTLLNNIFPVRAAYTPRNPEQMRQQVNHEVNEAAGQMLLIPTPKQYGFQLDERFMAYFRSNPVPMPLSLMKIFYDRPKAWDFAQIVLYRCFAAKSVSVIPWEDLIGMLGSEDTDHPRLKYTLNAVLKEVKLVYPNVPAEFLEGQQGLRVSPWRPETEGRPKRIR